MNQAEFTEEMVEAALEALLWSENISLPKDSHERIASFVPEDMRDLEGVPFDQEYEATDLPAEIHEKIRLDLGRFVEANWLDLWICSPEQAGHDFILARNETGSGFTSHIYSDEQPEVWKRLQAAAEKFNPINLYFGDDMKIYHWSEET